MTVPSIDLAALSVVVMRYLIVAITYNPILTVVLCAATVLWMAARPRIHSDLLLRRLTALRTCRRGTPNAVSGARTR
jgi:hypothetical protein